MQYTHTRTHFFYRMIYLLALSRVQLQNISLSLSYHLLDSLSWVSLDRLPRQPSHPLIILLFLLDQHLRRLRVGRTIHVRVAQQTPHRRQQTRHRMHRTPLLLNRIHAQRPVRIYVRMEHLRDEPDSRRGGWVGVRKRQT